MVAPLGGEGEGGRGVLRLNDTPTDLVEGWRGMRPLVATDCPLPRDANSTSGVCAIRLPSTRSPRYCAGGVKLTCLWENMADFEQQVQQLMAITGCEDQAFCAELLLAHSFDVVSAHAVNNLHGEKKTKESFCSLFHPLSLHISACTAHLLSLPTKPPNALGLVHTTARHLC